jgi:hypothetical protein
MIKNIELNALGGSKVGHPVRLDLQKLYAWNIVWNIQLL